MAISAPTAAAPSAPAPTAAKPTAAKPTTTDDSLTPDTPPSEDDEENDEESTSKMVWPGPTGPDGRNIPIDFFPDVNAGEENLTKLDELGSPMWIADIHRIPAEKYFVGPHVKLRWNAANMRRDADKLDLLADDAIKNPEKSKTLRSYSSTLDRMKTLMESLKAQGIDPAAQLAEMVALAAGENSDE